MKRSLLITSIAIIAAATMFTSCRKSFNCTCVYYDSKGNATTVGSFTFDEWRDDAQNLCNQKQATGFPNIAAPFTCDLK